MSFSYFKVIFHSFYSAEAYIDSYKNRSGFGLKYLFIVTILSSSLVSIGWLWNLSKINSEKITKNITEFILSEPSISFEENINRFIDLIRQIPEIIIKNGKVYVTEQQPYIIIDPITSHDFAIFDTSGKYKTLQGTDAVLLLTDKKFIMKDENGRENVKYIHDIIKSSSVDETSINGVLYIIAQIPSFGLYNSRFITSKDQTYTIFDKENRKLVEIGPDATLNDGVEPIAIITSDEIKYKTIFNKSIGTFNVAELNEQTLYEFVLSLVQASKKIILWIVPIFVMPFIVFTSFVFNCMMLLCCAFIGHSYIKMTKIGQFKYKEITRVAAVALTPMILVGATLPQVLPSQGTVYFLISIGYLYYAIRCITTR